MTIAPLQGIALESPAKARLQIRAVMVVVRVERARGQADEALRRRALELLDAARADLDGAAPWHADVLVELAEARAEVEK